MKTKTRMRRKLFSEDYTVRRKLFSEEPELKTIKCKDCGNEIQTKSTTSHFYCSKCGGRRFDVVDAKEHAPYQVNKIKEVDPLEKNRRKLFLTKEEEEDEFQRSFSQPDDLCELNLKRYSGETVRASESERLFGLTADEMIERGFADTEDNNKITVSENAFLQSRLFSKIVVSVTKILDLDPKITCCHNTLGNDLDHKADVIDDIESKGGLNPKGIILIKKAHGIDPEHHEESNDSWAEDSGILNDLRLEFGGSSQDLPEFKKTLDERYPDAPTSLLDLLRDRGVIKLDGKRVHVL